MYIGHPVDKLTLFSNWWTWKYGWSLFADGVARVLTLGRWRTNLRARTTRKWLAQDQREKNNALLPSGADGIPNDILRR